MDRVFIDTNVLLSGLIFKGNEADLLEICVRGEVRLVLGQVVINEARRVLRSKFPAHAGVLDAFLDMLEYDLVPPPSPEAVEQASALLRDPTDAPILASIVDANANVAISGDRDLLVADIARAYRIRRCADFLADLESRP